MSTASVGRVFNVVVLSGELFDAIEDRPLLIMPAIESSANTYNEKFPGTSNSYHFSQDFPGTPETPAPALMDQVLDLVSRYLFNIDHPEYASRSRPARLFLVRACRAAILR